VGRRTASGREQREASGGLPSQRDGCPCSGKATEMHKGFLKFLPIGLEPLERGFAMVRRKSTSRAPAYDEIWRRSPEEEGRWARHPKVSPSGKVSLGSAPSVEAAGSRQQVSMTGRWKIVRLLWPLSVQSAESKKLSRCEASRSATCAGVVGRRSSLRPCRSSVGARGSGRSLK